MPHIADGSAATNESTTPQGMGMWGTAAPLRFSGKHVHMIGVGGSGMCGAAKLLLHLGARVTGSDQTSFDTMGLPTRS